jgi:hypothetical protein
METAPEVLNLKAPLIYISENVRKIQENYKYLLAAYRALYVIHLLTKLYLLAKLNFLYQFTEVGFYFYQLCSSFIHHLIFIFWVFNFHMKCKTLV